MYDSSRSIRSRTAASSMYASLAQIPSAASAAISSDRLTRPQTRRRCSVLRRCRRGSAIVCLGIGAQPISGATHCMQELVREWFVDDVAQRMHVRAQDVTVRNFVAPQQIFELLTRDHAAVLTQQELENAARSEEHTSELQSLMRSS